MHPHGLPPSLSRLDRTLVLAVLNVTPDSFSDGGRFLDSEAAIAHGLLQIASGADIVDVGGESTRPGAQRIPVEEELRRVLPVVAELVREGVCVSIDTMRADVASAAVSAGAQLVNDVSGGLADDTMPATVADLGVPYVAMHWRGPSSRMDDLASYDNVVGEVCAELQQRLRVLLAAGVDQGRIILDPGLGFAKTAQHNWALLGALDRIQALGYPVLVGASRKRFLGELLADDSGSRPVGRRDRATDALSALAAAAGVWGVRVHDAASTRDAVAVAAAWRETGNAR